MNETMAFLYGDEVSPVNFLISSILDLAPMFMLIWEFLIPYYAG